MLLSREKFGEVNRKMFFGRFGFLVVFKVKNILMNYERVINMWIVVFGFEDV